MPKRPNSPDVIEVGRYYTVHHPYPITKNFQLEEDSKECARWIAACVGSQHLLTIYYKPKASLPALLVMFVFARNMILLNISKAFTRHGDILGEHRWREILKDPKEEDMAHSSKVFHSFYATERNTQKDGWKAVPVKDSWFYGWDANSEDYKFVDPYPEPHWCAVPSEDKTNKPLCRPLPHEQKAPPPREPAPVVGSSKWVEKQSGGPPAAAASSSAPGAGKPSLSVATGSSTQGQPSKKPTPPVMSPQSSGSGNASSGSASAASTAPKPKGAWGKPVPLKQFNAPEQKSGKSTWGSLPPAVLSGAKSPLKEEAPKGPINAWTKPLKVPPSERAPPIVAPVPVKAAPTPSPVSNSPWSQNSALTPASPSWATSASLTSPASASPHEPLPQVSDESTSDMKRKSDPKWSNNGSSGSKAAKKRDGKADSRSGGGAWGAARDKPPHQHEVSLDGKAGDDGQVDLETEVLHPWEAALGDWGPPPPPAGGKQGGKGGPGGARNGAQQGGGGQRPPRGPGQGYDRDRGDTNGRGGNSKWGDQGKGKSGPGGGGGGQGRQNDSYGNRDKGKGYQKKPANSWESKGSTSTDNTLESNTYDTNWTVETSSSNDWANTEVNLDWNGNEPSANDWGNIPVNTDWGPAPDADANGSGEAAANQDQEPGAQEEGADADEEDKGKGTEDATSSTAQDWGNGDASAAPALDAWGFPVVNDWSTGPIESTSTSNNAEVQLDWAGNPINTADWGVVPDGGATDWQPEPWDQIAEDKPAELICPTHNIACKKGICRDMARLVREQERKQRAEERRREGGWGGLGGGGRGGRGRGGGRGGYGGNNGNAYPVQYDENGNVKPHKKTRRGKKWYEKNYTGRMRAFADDDKAAAAGAPDEGNDVDDGAIEAGDEGEE